MNGFFRLVKEAFASARAQLVSSIVTSLMIAGMCVAVLLTQGRLESSKNEVLATMDHAASRAIIVEARSDAYVTSDVVDRFRNISSVEECIALSAAQDTFNASLPGSKAVPVRKAYGMDLTKLGVAQEGLPGSVYVSAEAMNELGLTDPVGAITTLTRTESYPVVDQINVPDFLTNFEPLAIMADSSTTEPQPVGTVIIIVKENGAIQHISDLIIPILEIKDSSKISISTSAEVAKLKQIIATQLSGSSQVLTASIFTITGSLVTIILTGLVIMKRKDYGRRRALGASQKYIVSLVCAQTTIVSIIGSITGGIIATLVLVIGKNSLPSVGYMLSVGVLSTAIGVLASLLPAAVAARREPAKELRTP